MNTITVFYDNSPYTLRWLRALIWAKKEFVDKGYGITFHGPSSFIPRYDTIVLLLQVRRKCRIMSVIKILLRRTGGCLKIFIIRKDIEKEFKAVICDCVQAICSSHSVTLDYVFQDINDISDTLPEGRTEL